MMEESPLSSPPEATVSERELLGYEVRSLSQRSHGPERRAIQSDGMFLITDEAGNVTPSGATDLGLVWRDTRFLSEYELGVPGKMPSVLSSRVKNNSLSLIDLTFTGIGNEHEFETHYVHIRREQILSGGLQERITVRNFYLESVRFTLQLRFGADYADLFEMRGMARQERGTYYLPTVAGAGSVFAYRGRDSLLRQTELRCSPAPVRVHDCHLLYELAIEPGQSVELKIQVIPSFEGEPAAPRESFEDAVASMENRYDSWSRAATSIEPDDEFLRSALTQNVTDFRSLLVHHEEQKIIAAGIPWYAVPFGRDGIIAALQTLTVQPEVAVHTLRFLAATQGVAYHEWTEEQPGKIMHELRSGEMARCGEVPHTPYYGTVDATPLFIILLHETFNWMGDVSFLEEMLPAAEAALGWIDRDGDADGDGFLEYERRCSRGLVNQGWKDSFDAIIFPDGRLAEGPIALVEVQGYVYDAKFRMADIYYRLGRTREANDLMQEAQWLRTRIDDDFWVPDTGYYALALDGEKCQVPTISSNPGHLLWSRVPSRRVAQRVRDVLMREDMFSGWGIRTLGRDQLCFNPISYHNGTIWPHDNALIAQGLCHYGFKSAAERVFEGLFEAGLHFRGNRLPELFCGMTRATNDFPVLYPVACDPQAWASGAYFQILHGLLGLQPDANRNELRINEPHVPRRLSRITYRNLRMKHSRISLEFTRSAGRTAAHVLQVADGPLKVNIAYG